MNFMCISLPRETIPRFTYAYTRSREILIEYNAFKGKVSEEQFKLPEFVKVHLCRHKDESEFPIAINDISPAARRSVETGQIMKYRNIGSYLKNQEEINSAVSILIVGSRAKREIAKLGPSQFLFIVVANDDLTKEKLMESFKGGDKLKITVAKKENISSEIKNLLERYALAPLKQISQECNSMLTHESEFSMEERTPTLSSTILIHPGNMYRKVKSKAEVKNVSASSGQSNGSIISRKVDQTTGKIVRLAKRQVIGDAEDTPFSKTVYPSSRSQYELKQIPDSFKFQDKHTEPSNNEPSDSSRGRKRKILSHQTNTVTKTDAKDESVYSDLHGQPDTKRNPSNIYSGSGDEFYERLLERILALYGLSNVPEEDRPDVPEQNYTISKELRDELFSTCSTIRRMGYRYRTFYIYAVKTQNPADEVERHMVITSLLKKYGINKFKIGPCDDHITKLSSVGARIEARSELAIRSRSVPKIKKGGTLGCFVNMNEAERQCCLLSKHVCEGCTEIYDVANGKNELLGRIIPETNTHQECSLDISAAFMDKPTDEEGRKFMDTKGNRTRGNLYPYNGQADNICRSGQPVYIYGATSSPGRGEITMPAVDFGLTSTLIQVEDKLCCDGKVDAPFAQKGDSGSITCVEDMNNDVHALSMVFGSPDLDPRERGTYLTIPLSKGIQQLEQNTEKTFSFC